MKNLVVFVALGVLSLACARVQVEAPKEPIKVDVSMRLDIYQHIEQDIDEIENLVSSKDKQSWLDILVPNAYADSFPAEVEEAVSRRADRRAQLVSFEGQGAIGENRNGLVELKGSDASAQSLIDAENQDRMLIYKAIAQKNGGTVSDVQSLYARRLQSDAPSGTPVEEASGWRIK